MNKMKRITALLLCLVLLCGIAPLAFAADGESQDFDFKKILSKRDGYEYDKFEKQWSWYKAYVREYSDAKVVIGMEAWGEDGGPNPDYMELYVKVLDEKGKKLWTVESVEFLLNDDVYSYKSMFQGNDSSSVVLGEDGQLLMKAIAENDGSDVSAKITADDGRNITLNLSKDKFTKTLKEFCRVALKYDFYGYSVGQSYANMSESMFPLTINGEVPEMG